MMYARPPIMGTITSTALKIAGDWECMAQSPEQQLMEFTHCQMYCEIQLLTLNIFIRT